MTVSEVSVLCVGYRNDIVQSESCYCVVSHWWPPTTSTSYPNSAGGSLLRVSRYYYYLYASEITVDYRWAWACMYSLPLLPSILYHQLWVCQPFCQNMGVTSNNYSTYINKCTKYLNILLLLTCEEVLHAPAVQIWAQISTILTPNNLLIVCHSSITNWSQNILLEFKVNVLV